MSLFAPPTEAVQHLNTSLGTIILAWVAIYNANFDPLRFRSPKSLLLAIFLIPLSIFNTRYMGERKYHFQAFKVAPMFDPSLTMEIIYAILIAFLATRRYRKGPKKWTDATLRTLPVYFVYIQLMALTPVFSDHRTQSFGVWSATLVDTALYIGAGIAVVLYAAVIAWRVVFWVFRCAFGVLRWLGKLVGL